MLPSLAFGTPFAFPDQVAAYTDFVFGRIGLIVVGHGILPPVVCTSGHISFMSGA
jgi:hypothetical protein